MSKIASYFAQILIIEKLPQRLSPLTFTSNLNTYMCLNAYITGGTDEDLGGNTYSKGFMHIHLNFNFKWTGDLKNLDRQELGSFAHEYVHYLQNLTTPWGLWESGIYYRHLGAILTDINENPESITVPFKINDKYISPKLRQFNSIVSNGIGSTQYTKDKIVEIILSDQNKDCPVFKIHFESGKVEVINLGSHIIKESMAVMCQRKFDPEYHNPYEMPYDIVPKIAETLFPGIGDHNFLIVACYLSLFSLKPGKRLLWILEDIEKLQPPAPKDYLDSSLKTGEIICNKGNTYNFAQLFSKCCRFFCDSMKEIPNVEIQAIGTILQQADLTRGLVPLVSPFIEKELNHTDMETIIGIFNAPIVTTNQNIIHIPLTASVSASSEFLALFGLELLIKTLQNPVGRCPLTEICREEGNEQEFCESESYKNIKDCPLIVMVKLCQINPWKVKLITT